MKEEGEEASVDLAVLVNSFGDDAEWLGRRSNVPGKILLAGVDSSARGHLEHGRHTISRHQYKLRC